MGLYFFLLALFLPVYTGKINWVSNIGNHLRCKCRSRIDGWYIEPDVSDPCYKDTEQICEMPNRNKDADLYCISMKCVKRSPTAGPSAICGQCGPSGVGRHPSDPVNFIVSNGEDCLSHPHNTECIKVKGYRVSCQSDYYVSGNNYAGVIVYDAGTYNNGKSGGRVYPGYTVMLNTANHLMQKYRVEVRQSGEMDEGAVHGYAVFKRFGASPTTMMEKYGMKFAGFAYKNGHVKFGSSTLNKRDVWANNVRQMVVDERVVVKGLIKAWQKNGIARSYWADASRSSSLIPYICEALKEFPKNTAFMYINTMYPECLNTITQFFD